MKEEQNVQISTFWSNLFKAPTEKEDLESVLLSMPPFAELKKKHIRLLMNLVHNRVYQPNEKLFVQGDPGIALFIVREGEIVVSNEDEENNVHKLATFSRGDFFGELAMLDNEVRSASATAIKESSVAVIFKPDIDEFIDRNPKEGVQILRGISRIIATRLRLVNQEYYKLFRQSK